MKFEEIIAELKNFEGTDEYKNYFGGKNELTAEGVKNYLNTDEGKKLLQPMLDSHFSKGLETWKSNNLEGLVNERIKASEPDAKDTELAALKQEMEQMKAEAAKKDLLNAALKTATEKGLPAELIEFFISADKEGTEANIKKFEEVFNAAVTDTVERKLSEGAYVPPKNGDEEIDGVTRAFMSLNPELKLQGCRAVNKTNTNE